MQLPHAAHTFRTLFCPTLYAQAAPPHPTQSTVSALSALSVHSPYSPTSLGHQAKESSCSFGTLVLIGVAAVCAVLTPFSARGLHAAG